jgi:hydroxypyruvate reductase
MTDPRALLRAMFDAAVAAARPANVVPPHLPSPPKGRLVVLGAGKASAAMAKAVEDHWPGELSGLVVTRHGHAAPCGRIEIVEAGHPIPDEAGLDASRRMMAIADGLGRDDLALCLISGGGSALLALPHPPLTLADERAVNAALLASGAPIGEMNVVRRHISAIKGGRLAAACHPAKVLSLLISDVPGDDPVDIASGPTVADPTTCGEALAVLDRRRIDGPPALRGLLASGASETVKPGDPRLARVRATIVAAPRLALDAAAAVAREAGIAARILGDAIEGEARIVGAGMAALARDGGFARPCVLLSGGETTVTVRGRGRGGRNVEFLLALAIALGGAPGIHALAADTDGIDGAGDAAGAWIGPDSLARARARGVDPVAALDENDGHGFFGALGDQLVTGPTLTNVNDFRAILLV